MKLPVTIINSSTSAGEVDLTIRITLRHRCKAPMHGVHGFFPLPDLPLNFCEVVFR